jgi:hypothetical protein
MAKFLRVDSSFGISASQLRFIRHYSQPIMCTATLSLFVLMVHETYTVERQHKKIVFNGWNKSLVDVPIGARVACGVRFPAETRNLQNIGTGFEVHPS